MGVGMEYFIFTLLVVYLSPWLMAEKRERDDATRILFLTLFLGWTFVGWLEAWRRALSPPPAPPPKPELRVLANPLPRRTPRRAPLRRVESPAGRSRARRRS